MASFFPTSTFGLAVPNFLIQGGDISYANGVGGESIYGGYFEDESFEVCVVMVDIFMPHLTFANLLA